MSIDLLPGSGASLRTAAELVRSTLSALDAVAGAGDCLGTLLADDVWRGHASSAFELAVSDAQISTVATGATGAMTAAASAVETLAGEHDRHQDELRYLRSRWESLMAAGVDDEALGELLALERRAGDVHRMHEAAEERMSASLGAVPSGGRGTSASLRFFWEPDCPGAQTWNGSHCVNPALPLSLPPNTPVISEDPGPSPSESNAGVIPSDPTTIGERGGGDQTDRSLDALAAFLGSQLGQTIIGLWRGTSNYFRGKPPGGFPLLDIPFDRCLLDPWSCQDEDETIAAGP